MNLYMHEFAMHLDQGVESPKSPRARENGGNQGTATQPEVLTTAHIGALTTCLTSIHGLFDTFLKFSAEEVRTVPVFYFVRIAYATVLLIKMYFAATSPESEFGKVIASDDMRVEHYLSSLRNLLQTAAAYSKCRPARSSSLVLVMLRTWFERQRDGKSGFSEEISGSTRPDAQPVDISHHAPKQEYKRMQLNGDPPSTRRSSAPQAPAQASAEGMDQSRLHVLGEVALGNSNANGHHLGHSGDQWSSFQTNPMGTTSHAYPAYDYPAPVAAMDAGPYDTVMHGYHSGLEQAIGMTFNEGNLSYMDDYALYNMMQMPNMFENVG